MNQLTDPITQDDPFLDADGPAAARVLRTATRRRPARRALPAAITAGATAAAAAAGLALLPGTSAQEALAQAAASTAAITEGRVVTTVEVRVGDDTAHARNEMTFDGNDYEMRSSTEDVLPGGGSKDVGDEYRVVGDTAWHRRGGGPWTTMRAGDPATRNVAGAIDRVVRDSPVLAAVEEAADLTEDERSDGTTVYRGTVPTGTLHDGGLLAPPGAPGGGPEYRVTVTVGPDGIVRELVLESPGSRRVTTYETGDVPPIAAP